MSASPSALSVGGQLPSTFGYSSASGPLLTKLHDRLVEYEDAVDHVYEVRKKYGLRPGFQLDPPSGELVERMNRVSNAFDSVMAHVDAVDTYVDREYVVLRREACGAANVLFRAPPSLDQLEDAQRTVYTRSPILRHSSELGLSFRPFPSREVLLKSKILSHSSELRRLAAPTEMYQ